MRDGWDVQLVHTELDWSGSAKFGDEVVVEVTTDRIGTTSFTLGYRVLRGDELLVTAKTVYVVIDINGSGKRPVPDDLRAALTTCCVSAAGGEDVGGSARGRGVVATVEPALRQRDGLRSVQVAARQMLRPGWQRRRRIELVEQTIELGK